MVGRRILVRQTTCSNPWCGNLFLHCYDYLIIMTNILYRSNFFDIIMINLLYRISVKNIWNILI